MKGDKMKTIEQILTATELQKHREFHSLINNVSPEWREEVYFDQMNEEMRQIFNKIRIVRAMEIPGLWKYKNFNVKTGYFNLVEKIVLDDHHFISFANREPEIWYQSESGGSFPLDLKNKSKAAA